MGVFRVGRVVALFCAVLATGWLAFASTSAAQAAGPFAEVTLPDRIEAEHYDSGAEGVAWSDTDEHAGRGDFRTDDNVDAFVINNVGASGRTLLGRTRDGEFVRYTVNVDTAEEYDVRLRVASGHPSPGVIHVDIDGNRVGTIDGDTDTWFDWTARSAGTVTLEPGTHTVQLTWADGAQINLDWLDLTPTTPQPATCDTGTLEAEDATLAGRFEIATASDITFAAVPRGSGGWWNGVGDNYVEFCAGVETAGDYRIDATIMAVSQTKRSFYVTIDDGPPVEFVAPIPRVGEWRTIPVNDAGALDPLRPTDEPAPTIDTATWNLQPGDHTIRFYLRRDGTRLDNITVAPTSAPLPPAACADCDILVDLYNRLSIAAPPGNPCGWFTVTCDENQRITRLVFRVRSLPSSTVPPEVIELTELESLDVGYSGLTELPPEIANLTNLTTLRAPGNELTELPPEIGQLVNLGTLSLSDNPLTSLPSELANLDSLTDLYLYDTGFTSLPPEVTDLTGLTFLQTGGSNMTSMPAEIGNLTTLEVLFFQGSGVTALPAEIGDLSSLKRLGLRGNQLTTLPPEVGNLTNLVELAVDGNRLTELPIGIGNLTSLRILDATGNNLTGDITALEVLLAATPRRVQFADGLNGNNCLTTTNGDLAALLTSLDPEWDRCDDFCADCNVLAELYDAMRLDTPAGEPCDWNNVVCDGDDNIIELDLSFRDLTSLTAEIGQLTNLTRLDLSGNSLRRLPSEFSNLTNLRTLDLSLNNLTFPHNLESLSTLNLQGNRISGDITPLERLLGNADLRIFLADGGGGNECLTTTNPELAAFLTASNAGWDRCDNP